MTQAKPKIQGKFYALKNDEWVRACQELTSGQRDVLYFIRTLDPYGEKPLNLGVTDIARQLKLDKSTVSRALKVLDQKGWIDLELIQVRVKILSQGKCCTETTVLPTDNSVASEQQARSLRNEDDPDATSAIATQQARSLRNDQEPEPLPNKDSNSSKTIKTYLDFIQTLSESEREIFLEFGRKKAANLPHPPELPDKWIAANFTELYKQFLASSTGRKAKQEAITRKYDWENDPRLMDWLHKAYYEGHPWAIENEFERKERLAFLMWAQKTNAYAGRIADEPT